MKQFKWAFFQLMLWALEPKLWMDGLPWEQQLRISVAERSKDLAKATHARSELEGWTESRPRDTIMVRYWPRFRWRLNG